MIPIWINRYIATIIDSYVRMIFIKIPGKFFVSDVIFRAATIMPYQVYRFGTQQISHEYREVARQIAGIE